MNTPSVTARAKCPYSINGECEVTGLHLDISTTQTVGMQTDRKVNGSDLE